MASNAGKNSMLSCYLSLTLVYLSLHVTQRLKKESQLKGSVKEPNKFHNYETEKTPL